ncbi:MAG: ABC transporter permease [Bacteroidales bacterium]|nr:ABC transporter permease [Bacteroidales bacterium]
MKLSWFIASRIGNGKKGRLASLGNVIAVLSVAASILVIIISICVSRGFRKEIMEKMSAFAGDVTISVMPPTGGADFNTEDYSLPALRSRQDILSLPYVKAVQAVSYRPGMIKTEDNIQGVMMKGVDSTFDWSFYGACLEEGTVPEAGSDNFAFISRRMADLLGFKCGDKATFYFVGEQVKVRRLEICGIYSAQLENLDKAYVLCPKKVVNSLNGWEDGRSSSYQILFKDHFLKDYHLRKNQIVNLVYDKLEEGEYYRISGAVEDMSNLVDWLQLLDMNVLIILILMIAVAAFNMVSCVLIILFENISSIGVLKALGMKNSGIKKVFLAKSSSIVLTGLLIGNVIAIGLLLLQKHFKILSLNPANYFIDHVPVDISWWSILAADVISFIAIMAILLIPCHFISRIQPSKTIRVR